MVLIDPLAQTRQKRAPARDWRQPGHSESLDWFEHTPTRSSKDATSIRTFGGEGETSVT